MALVNRGLLGTARAGAARTVKCQPTCRVGRYHGMVAHAACEQRERGDDAREGRSGNEQISALSHGACPPRRDRPLSNARLDASAVIRITPSTGSL